MNSQLGIQGVDDWIGTPITLDKNDCLTVSYSSFGMMGNCPRKFSMYKVFPDEVLYRDETPALSQGKAVGHGYAYWLETGNIDQAILETWRNYYPLLEDNVRSVTKACVIVEKLAAYPMEGYQLAVINGKPCVETSFCIKLSSEERDAKTNKITKPAIYFIGFLDAILQHVDTGNLLPLELKTTSIIPPDHIKANFMNSTQGNGYGLILDAVRVAMGQPAGLTYDIKYLVAQAHRTKADQFNPTIHPFTFTKTIIDRLEWLIDLKLTQQRLQSYLDFNMFPRNGSACLRYNRLCAFNSICNLTNTNLPAWDRPRGEDYKPATAEFDFYFDVSELISGAVKLSQEL